MIDAREWLTLEVMPDGTPVIRNRLRLLEASPDCVCQMSWRKMLANTEVEWQRR